MDEKRIISEKRLTILKEDLLGKKGILDQLLVYIESQHASLEVEAPDMKAIDKILQEKERMYLKIEKVDARINGHLSALAEIEGISHMHPDLSADVKAIMLEIRNTGEVIHKREQACRDLIQKEFNKHKTSVKTYRQTKGVLNQYNKSMGNVPETGASFFMDKKK